MTVASSAAAAVALAFAVAAGAGSSAAGVDAAAPELYVLTAQSDSVVRNSHPLFDGSILVPLATAHDRFAVQNGSGGIAYLRIALTTVDVPDDGLRRALTLGVSTARASGPVVPLDSSGSCVTVLTGQPVAPGASVDVDAALALGDLTGTSGQSIPIGFSLLVILDADPAGAGCDTGGAGGGGGAPPPGRPERPNGAPLAATGSDLLAAIWIAAAFGGAGTAAVFVSRALRGRTAARRRVRHDSNEEG